MTWSLALPNLLIGLREGLEAGLIVTILLGAMRTLAPERGTGLVWLGTLSAAALSFSFGAVLTFTRTELGPRAQEVFGGTLSLVAAVLVTSMVFWMRSAARSIGGELRGRLADALAAGGAMVAVASFVSVAREGLETALFVWTNAQAAGSTTSPLIGAVLGLLVAVGICALLFRRVVRINLGRFFTVTGAALTVVVAGVLAYGIGDLQDAGVLPGLGRTAFDLSRHLDSGSWWVETLRGITNLDVRMSWLQVLGYLGYLGIVLPLFLAGRRDPGTAAARTRPTAPVAEPAGGAAPARRGLLRPAIAAAVVLPVLAGAGWVALDHHPRRAGDAAITLTASSCAGGWAAPRAGRQSYTITNATSDAVDVELLQATSIVAEIEVLGPGTTRSLPVTLGAGSYRWACVFDGRPTLRSEARTVTAATGQPRTVTLVPTTEADLRPVLGRYEGFVRGQLATITGQLDILARAVAAGDRAAAERAWLAAHLTYHRIGAAYGAFGATGDAVDGLAQGLPAGTADPSFTGFHRIERGLWSGAALGTLAPRVAALRHAVGALVSALPQDAFDPNEVTVRAHEIEEDTLRFTLTGQDDYGSGSGFRTAAADLDGTQYLLGLLAPLLRERQPGLVEQAQAGIAAVRQALAAAGSTPVGQAALATRQRVDAATGGLLETLSPIPDLLEIRNP
ncbi:MAG TPA: iron uptake transporter permease EfeU [Jatrophihabitans sp.]|nr:iron uptake transporter permease EfeU [Jatrophihabitans sp.]